MTDTIDRLANILRHPDSLQADVDFNLTTKVSEYLKEALREIENVGMRLKLTSNLIVKAAQFNQLQSRLLNFLGQLGNELQNSEGQGKRISPEQHLFLKQVIATCIYHQTYLQLLARSDLINQTYTRISNIQLIKSNQIMDIGSLLDSAASSNAQDFITQITNTTSTTFDSIRNLDAEIDTIKRIIVLRPLTQNASYTFIMLTGPPGTGKTSIARAVASYHSGGVYLNLDIAALLGQYVGDTEKKIAQLFRYVGENRSKKFTIILDELDIVLGSGTENAAYLTTLRNSLQIALDPEILGPNVVICGITNYFNRLNDVIRRRATNTFYIPVPSIDDSLEYLFGQIEQTFYSFLFEITENMPSPISTQYRNEISSVFRSLVDVKITNANMKNIASTASASAMSNPNNIFVNYTRANRTLKICLRSVGHLSGIQVTPSLTNNAVDVSDEIRSSDIFYPYVFILPDLDSIQDAINQTPLLTVEKEEQFRRDNQVTLRDIV